MKHLFLLSVVFFLGTSKGFADDLAEGHWLSEKIDKERKVVITYDNWAEESLTEGRIYRAKAIKETPYEAATPPSTLPAPSHPPSSETWYCYAHDYIDGHEQQDPKDDSCIGSYFKGKGHCQEKAAEIALAQCLTRSRNPKTCELFAKKNCFPESKKLKP